MGQWTEGEKGHRAALALEPDSDYLHNNLGYNLLLQNRHEEAAREFERALQFNPKSVQARNNLALALANKGDLALREWQKVNDPASAHNNLAAVLIEQGRYTDARGQLDIALGYNRRHPAALANLKLVSELDGRPAEVHLGPPVLTRWERWRSTVMSWFTGPVPGQERTAAPAASANNGRGL
jgi:Flp pilus assembly protein TadD